MDFILDYLRIGWPIIVVLILAVIVEWILDWREKNDKA